ncbi:PREDICTED: uncharacterized protein LOC109353792 [Lupinus angustifolius]|uniref:uncharacterized protein LOC109353792 n=1 Tax=Lupinus angustifolius TaxID=3871 RepID=UPI00092EA279|nr:PREDICTED: uncharacterized protein LOC109353792 [Lupinus angustifolius]
MSCINHAIPWKCLIGVNNDPILLHKEPTKANHVDQPQGGKKSFIQALNNTPDLVPSQLPEPCLKGDAIAIKIPESDYQEGLIRCKTHLHGRIIFSKGDTPLKFTDLKSTPISLDMATSNRSFGHFAKVLVEIDLKAKLPDQILVEREGGKHTVEKTVKSNIKNKVGEVGATLPVMPKNHLLEQNLANETVLETSNVDAANMVERENDLIINLEIDNTEEINLDDMEKLEVNTHSRGNGLKGKGSKLTHSEGDYPSEDEDLSLSSNDNMIVQETTEIANQEVAQDIRLVGRLWADQSEVEEERDDYTPNCRGSGSSKTRLFLKNLCDSNNPDFVFIAEPMIPSDSVNDLVRKELKLKVFVTNNRGHQLPSIWGLCKYDFNLSILNNSDQKIAMEVNIDNNRIFLCVVYANNSFLQRRHLWSDVQSVMDANPDPWCCIGDFNVVLGAHECRSARLPAKTPCLEFKSFSDSAGLLHLNTLGAQFTWTNKKRGNALTEKRLDRALCNEDWLTCWNQENKAQKDLLDALMTEEIFWKEKARVKWFTQGDRNTSFFHKVTKIRHATKSISRLLTNDNILSNQEDIDNHIIGYYKDLFASPNDTHTNNLIHDVIPPLVNQEENSMLTEIPSNEEIKKAVFDLNGEGAPGPDGFGGCFYQAFWDIIDIQLLPNLNSNNVILFPKTPGADRIEEFRPIALANFQFKIITKVIADRLARIISPQQKGFIKDRKIHDCICIASEAINLLDHKTFGGNLAIKLDIKKAFDTMDWIFLLDTLKAFGFNQVFIHWIEVILKSAMLSININGRSVGFFQCKRGVRQGDPLSPLLFCIAEDALSRGISNLVREGKISTISGPKGLQTPSHILYADDIFLFCKGKKAELVELKKLIKDYAEASGQHVNSKCTFYTASSSPRRIASLVSYLGFSVGSLPVQYLGIPLFKGRPKKIHLQPIADRILAKLATWKGSTLSMTGRVELVRSIIQSMLVYSFKIYKWPGNLLKLVDKGMRNFIWYGDIGVRKQRFGSTTFAAHRQFKSSIWTRIKDNWIEVVENSIWLVGDDTKINFWTDNWTGTTMVDSLQIPLNLHSKLKAKVANFIMDSKWLIPAPMIRGLPTVVSSITHISRHNGLDRLVWKNSCEGDLHPKIAYEHVTTKKSLIGWCNLIWSLNIPPSQSFITWRLMLSKLPTDENLKLRGLVLVSKCNLCNEFQEDTDHLFFNCKFALAIWDWFHFTFDTHTANQTLPPLICNESRKFSSQTREIFIACMVHTIATIWFCRNQNRFNDYNISINQAIAKIKRASSFSGICSKSTSLSCSVAELLLLRKFQTPLRISKAPRIVEVVWERPREGWIKVNTDGAAKGFPGLAGVGGIFRNNHGDFIACFAEFIDYQFALYAEIFAVIQAVNLARNNGWNHLWIECDSTTVVEIFNNKAKVPWKISTA